MSEARCGACGNLLGDDPYMVVKNKYRQSNQTYFHTDSAACAAAEHDRGHGAEEHWMTTRLS